MAADFRPARRDSDEPRPAPLVSDRVGWILVVLFFALLIGGLVALDWLGDALARWER